MLLDQSRRRHVSMVYCHENGAIGYERITHNYIGDLQVYCHLGDCPHACSRVEKKTVPVDSMKHPHDSNPMSYWAVVWDLPERGKIVLIFLEDLRAFVDDTRDILWFPFRPVHGACQIVCKYLI